MFFDPHVRVWKEHLQPRTSLGMLNPKANGVVLLILEQVHPNVA